ncbi:hypothetical protein Lser_V15G46274 [Lactuca serriola]
MRNDNIQNFYTNWEHNGGFDHHYTESPNVSVSATLEGSSNNGGFEYQTDSNNRNLNLHPQGGSPIGLNLRKSNSLINLVEMTLSQERELHKNSSSNSKPTPEKLKASNFPALLLQIGSWKRVSRNEGDLVTKIYYAKKKLVWEFLDGPLKSKIEIQWSEISAIRALIYEGQPGHLEVEINQPPQFGREINPQPRKHTQWKQSTDFTGGQASICRRHSIIFAPGVLDKQYEKLLQYDNRLFNLSQQPFPINNYSFFYNDPNHYVDYSYMDPHHRPTNHFLRDHAPILPNLDEGTLRHVDEYQDRVHIQFEGNPTIPIGMQKHFLPYYEQDTIIPIQEPGMKMLSEESDYINNRIPGLLVNSRISIQESNYRISVPNPYADSWETGTENLGCSNGYQQFNPNWT